MMNLRNLSGPPCPTRKLRRVPELLALGGLLASVALGQTQRLLHYGLVPGDEVLYERRETVTDLQDHAIAQRATRIQLYCLQQENDELLLLFVAANADNDREPSHGVVFSINTHGQRQISDETATRLAPLDYVLDLVPMLPTPVQDEREWTTAPDLFGRRYHYQTRGPDAQHKGALRIDYTVQDVPGVAELLQRRSAGTFWFDAAAGGVTGVETLEEDRRLQRRTHAVTVLQRHTPNTAQWAARRATEAAGFNRTLVHEDRLLHRLFTDPGELARTLREVDRLWAAFNSDVDQHGGSPFVRLALGRRQEVRDSETEWRARTRIGRSWIGRPAREWSLQDAGGETHKSETDRRGVVVEVFWATDSLESLRALDAIRRLQTDLKRAGVPLLCYNMDVDPERARAAIELCGQGLRNLLGGPLQMVEPLDRLPLLRLVDAAGIVREIWLGWRPDYSAVRDAAVSQTERSP